MKNPVEMIGEEKVTKILQEKELLMLVELKKIFEEYNIPFFLACGTALGCARHKGFIPWDDDIDIYIRGKDYLEIRDLFKEIKDSNIAFHDHATIENYPYTFPKIVLKGSVLVEESLNDLQYNCGVYIDVFPIFGISNNRFIRVTKEAIRYLRYAIIRAYYNRSFSSGARGIIGHIIRAFINPETVQRKLEQTYINDLDDTEYLVDSCLFHKKALLKKADFEETIYMEFENTKMPMPKDFDHYLRMYYGDYLTLPPEKERTSHHFISNLEIEGVKELFE